MVDSKSLGGRPCSFTRRANQAASNGSTHYIKPLKHCMSIKWIDPPLTISPWLWLYKALRPSISHVIWILSADCHLNKLFSNSEAAMPQPSKVELQCENALRREVLYLHLDPSSVS